MEDKCQFCGGGVKKESVSIDLWKKEKLYVFKNVPANAPEFEIFRLLLALTALAFIFFGEAASLPALLLCIFGFGIAFPKLVDAYAGMAYAQFSTRIAYSIGSLLSL